MRSRQISIEDITVDNHVNQRTAGVDPIIVLQYVQDTLNGAELPPCVVYEDKKTFWLSEGFHRYAMAEELEWEKLPCEVRSGGRKEAILNACGSNAEHGSRRTNADKRKAVITLLGMKPNRSARWIAEQAKVGSKTVDRIKDELRQRRNSQSGGNGSVDKEPATTTGRDGKTYQSKKPAKKKAPSIPVYKATETFSNLLITIAGLHDRLAQDYEYDYAAIFKSDEWDDSYSNTAMSCLKEAIKITTNLKRELAEHVKEVTKNALD